MRNKQRTHTHGQTPVIQLSDPPPVTVAPTNLLPRFKPRIEYTIHVTRSSSKLCLHYDQPQGATPTSDASLLRAFDVRSVTPEPHVTLKHLTIRSSSLARFTLHLVA